MDDTEIINALDEWGNAPIFVSEDFEKAKWEQRRYEIAKAMLPVFYKRYDGTITWQCQLAIKYADVLIEELQRPKEQ